MLEKAQGSSWRYQPTNPFSICKNLPALKFQINCTIQMNESTAKHKRTPTAMSISTCLQKLHNILKLEPLVLVLRQTTFVYIFCIASWIDFVWYKIQIGMKRKTEWRRNKIYVYKWK
jgi:hypothetical protein